MREFLSKLLLCTPHSSPSSLTQTMSALAVTVWAVLLLSAGRVCTCPDSTWTAGPDTCYLTSSAALTFDGGLEWCGQRGGYLAEITSAAEQKFVESFLR